MTDDSLYMHAHMVRDIEAAYKRSAKEGRAALMSVILGQYSEGYDTGLSEGLANATAPIRSAGRR